MALTLVKEDGTGLPNANTYALVADGDAYHEAHLYATAWTGASTANKEAALAMATRLIDAEFQFNGFKVSSSQALQWPREGCPDPDKGNMVRNPLSWLRGENYVDSDIVPRGVVNATCELARELLVLDRTAAPAGEGISRQRLADSSEITYNKKDRRPVVSHVAMALLCKYGASSKGNGTVRLLRG